LTTLRKNSSGSWDNLAKNTDMVIGDSDEDQGLDLTLGLFYAVEVEILPQEGRARIRFFERELHATLLDIEWSLGIPRETEITIEHALGVLRRQTDLELEIPLLAIVKQALAIIMPLRPKILKLTIKVPESKKPVFKLDYLGKLGKPKSVVVRNLRTLREILKGD